jgi:hypothetical protein
MAPFDGYPNILRGAGPYGPNPYAQQYFYGMNPTVGLMSAADPLDYGIVVGGLAGGIIPWNDFPQVSSFTALKNNPMFPYSLPGFDFTPLLQSNPGFTFGWPGNGAAPITTPFTSPGDVLNSMMLGFPAGTDLSPYFPPNPGQPQALTPIPLIPTPQF